MGFFSNGQALLEFAKENSDSLSVITSANLATPAFGDIDGDGDLDVFIGQMSLNAMKFYENIGSAEVPHFEEKTGVDNPLSVYSNNSGCNAPSLVDIDADGDLDAFVGYWENAIKYYENTGDSANPNFVVRTGLLNPLDSVYMPGRCTYPTFADFDGDNDLDAFISDDQGNIAYYENIGNATTPTFTENTSDNPFNFIVLTGALKLHFNDFNKDGLTDVLIGNSTDSKIHYLRNEGASNAPVFYEEVGFDNPFDDVTGPGTIVPQLIDLNADGMLDLAVGVSQGVNFYQQYLNIVDDNFKAALIGNSAIDIDNNDQISLQEANAFSGEININSLGVNSLFGLQSFTEMTVFKAASNSFISPDWNEYTSLTELWLGNNGITSIDISQLSALTTLNLIGNNLDSIELSNNQLLKTIVLTGNEIKNLDLSGLEFVEILGLGNNLLTELDVSGLSQLKELYVWDNNISSLDLTMNIALTELEANETGLTNLNIQNGHNTSITSIVLSDNPNLTCIQVDDPVYSTTNWTNKDFGATYSTDCVTATENMTTHHEGIFIYPNPVNEIVNLEIAVSGDYILYNQNGQDVMRFSLDAGLQSIDLSSLNTGVYILRNDKSKSIRISKL